MQVKLIAVAASLATVLALAGTAAADVNRPGSASWSGIHASDYTRPQGSKWGSTRPHSSRVWAGRIWQLVY